MRVFDFDGTLYDGDSTVDFYLFCLRRHPSLFHTIFPIGLGTVSFKMKRLSAGEFKERYFKAFLPKIDASVEVEAFWHEKSASIKKDVSARLERGDVIISASPAFLLAGIAADLGADLIATDIDPLTGCLRGKNVHDLEKVLLFEEKYPETKVEEFYTDDVKADAPMIEISEKAFLVDSGKIMPVGL